MDELHLGLAQPDSDRLRPACNAAQGGTVLFQRDATCYVCAAMTPETVTKIEESIQGGAL